jgi:hypothetical protein
MDFIVLQEPSLAMVAYINKLEIERITFQQVASTVNS